MTLLHRARAWLERPSADVLAARETRIAQLEEQAKRLTEQVGEAHQQAIEATARATRLAADLAAAQAMAEGRECVCRGDAELHWRTRANDAELRAARDRANCNAMADRLAKAEGRRVVGSLT